MLFRVKGKVFAETPGGQHPYTEVEARMEDGVKALIPTAGGVDALPADAYPMTYDEALTRMEPTEAKPKAAKKAVKKDVPDVQ